MRKSFEESRNLERRIVVFIIIAMATMMLQAPCAHFFFLLGTSHPVGGIETIPWGARDTADLESYALFFFGRNCANILCGFQPPVSKESDLFVLDIPLFADIGYHHVFWALLN